VYPVIFDPGIEIPDDVRAFGLHAEGREGLHLLEVELLLIGVSDAAVGYLYGILELVRLILAAEHLSKMTTAQNRETSEFLI
jgi:hypothetical protein